MSDFNDWISVVMPVCDAGDYLYDAVDSILQQSHANLELLIIDDHSTDGAIQKIRHEVIDPRLRILDSPGKGIVAALNFGIERAKYEIIARMDGDDIASPDRLEKQLEYAKCHPDIDIIATKVDLFKDNGQLGKGYLLYQNWINGLCEHEGIASNIFIESPLPHPSIMFNKTVFNTLGGYRDHGWPEDYDLWLRAFLLGLKFGKPETKALIAWRDHDDRASRQEPRYDKSGFLRCKAYYLSQYLTQHLGLTTCAIWGTGPTGLKLHDHLEEQGIEVKYFYDINPKMRGRRKRDKPIIIIESDADRQAMLTQIDNNTLCLAAVSARGARDKLAQLFGSFEWIQEKNFIFVA